MFTNLYLWSGRRGPRNLNKSREIRIKGREIRLTTEKVSHEVNSNGGRVDHIETLKIND